MTSRSRNVSRRAGRCPPRRRRRRPGARAAPRRPRARRAGPGRAGRAARARGRSPSRAPRGSVSSLLAPSPGSVRTRCCSAASLSPSSVVTPSSRQIRAAVFGPSPGSRRNCVDLVGHLGPPLLERRHVARLGRPRRSSPRSSRRCPGSSFALPASASSATERAGVADPGRRAAVGERRESPARRGSPRGPRAVERVGQVAVARERRPCVDHRDASAGRSGQTRAMTRAVVCLPTYNERENLEPMVRALGEVLDTTRDRVLVIDDGSPDGTGEIADGSPPSSRGSTSCTGPRRRGIGRAYLAGFARALAAGAELVLEMDCDFSHDPADVPRLIAACEAGADLALGSRWVDGGGTVNWGLVRRRSSRAAAPSTRGSCSGVGDPRPDRRVQVLPPAPCSRRSTSTRSPPGATASRSRAPTARCGPGSASSRSRSRSSTAASASRR